MKINYIGLTNFMSHDATGLVIPDTGVTVLTGPNGAGKSTFIEAVAFAYFGRTLRETPPWRRGIEGLLVVNGSCAFINRRISAKGTKNIHWHTPAEDDVRKYDTPSKAEAELGKTVGSFDLWRRTHVFSSADASNFSSLPDSKRKAMIEAILGTAIFHDASAACRQELSDAREQLDITTCNILANERRQRELGQSLKTLIEPALVVPRTPPLIDPCCTKDDLAASRATAVVAKKAWTAACDEPEFVLGFAQFATGLARSQAAVDTADKAKDLAVAGKCIVCGQDYDASVTDAEAALASCHTALAKAQRLQATEVDLMHTMNAARQEKITSTRAELDMLIDLGTKQALRLTRADDRQAEIDRHEETCTQIEAQYAAAHKKWSTAKLAIDSELLDLEDSFDDLAANRNIHRRNVAELEVCDKVLGLKGVRVAVLGRALGAAEVLANGWLSQMSSPITIALKPFKVLKSGETNDDIGFEVQGVGEGYGYKAASGGERRRIDAALLLAFAEVASASSGQPGGTLWMDEIDIALDTEGCEMLGNIIADIGTRRSVVVITHRQDLVDTIARSCRGSVEHTHYRVEDGRLSTPA